MSTFKWIIGGTITAFIALFSISIYTAQSVESAIDDVRLRQERVITTLDRLKTDISDLKTLHKDDIKEIKNDLNEIVQTIKEHDVNDFRKYGRTDK